ncbi:MAG: cytochrome c3 family protein [Pseudomonadota bacterium]
MSRARPLAVLAGLLLLGAGLLGGAPRPLADDPFARFDHEQHRTHHLKNKVSCQACHPIGMVTGTDDFLAVKQADEVVLTPARAICHDCHTGALRWPRAPTRCTTCHVDLAPLIPEDHALGWERDHGWASLRHGSSCDLCHTVGYCETCHSQRDERRATVHPATFRSTHGIEARMDPGRCQRCHLESSCEACHTGGGLP